EWARGSDRGDCWPKQKLWRTTGGARMASYAVSELPQRVDLARGAGKQQQESVMPDTFLAPGLRTPFFKAGGADAGYAAPALPKPLAAALAARARPDFVVWSQVIPDPLVSNIARELVFEAGLDPEILAFSTILACASSMAGAIQAAAMVGRGGA